MNYQAIPNPAVELFNLKEKIHEKIVKAKAVLTCAMFSAEFVRDDVTLDNSTLYHALWVVDEYLDDLSKISDSILS